MFCRLCEKGTLPPFTALMMPSNGVKYIVAILANVCLHFFPELEVHCREEKEMEGNRVSHNRIEGKSWLLHSLLS